MARKPRIDYPGAWHHVVNRGARKQPVFAHYNDAISFLDLLGETAVQYNLEVHGFALMPNHYHLLVRSPHANLSRTMRTLGVRYTQALNRRYDWDGPLFRGRFHSQHIADDTYLDNVLTYVHLNPVRAGLVEKPGDSHVTSYRAYVGLEPRPSWLQTATMHERLGNELGVAEATRSLLAAERPWLDGFSTTDGWIAADYLAPAPTEAYEPEQYPAFRSPGEALQQIAALVGLTRRQLMTTQLGRGRNKARRFAVWALTVSTPLTQSEIGGHLNMTSAAVAVALHRIRKNRATDETLKAWCEQWPPA